MARVFLRTLVLLGLLLTLASAARAEDPQPPIVVRSAHYELHYAGPQSEADEYSKVLEAAYVEFAEFFGATPKLKKDERLQVRFTQDRASFNAAIRADNTQPPGGAGGYYWPGSKTAYLFRQPTIYFTRALLIHEAAHQFHYLARTKNKNPGAGWYSEGVAEHLSWHMWDGITLRLGIRAPITLKDYPRLAAKELGADGFDLQKIVNGDVPASRPVSWALYRYLATGKGGAPLKGFATFCKKVDRGTKPATAFKAAFRKTQKVLEGVRAMLAAEAQPWDHTFNQWEMRAPGRMRGMAGVVSVCRVRAPLKELRADLEVPTEGRWKGGLLLSLVDSQDYTVLLVNPAGGVVINRRRAGAWKRLVTSEIAPPKRGSTLPLRAEATDKGVVVHVGEKVLGPIDVPPGAFGLAIEDCTLHFQGITQTK